MAHVICQPCVGTKDTACKAVCPVDCIYDDGLHLVIDPDVCVDCGVCIAACPVSAIFPESQVPTEWKAYIVDAKDN